MLFELIPIEERAYKIPMHICMLEPFENQTQKAYIPINLPLPLTQLHIPWIPFVINNVMRCKPKQSVPLTKSQLWTIFKELVANPDGLLSKKELKGAFQSGEGGRCPMSGRTT